ncbi:UNVERIFIED_CONTAM: hypothetical protein PYX00_006634 [Menopon gallinae]|uniref:Protein shuttle craft n=1 Tax=Menopon gallinae TaxID=328185 RepID=A0AAW2HWC6_9NEOP
MEEGKEENLEEVIARSNLVATAEEFVPKSKITEESAKFENCGPQESSSVDGQSYFNHLDQASNHWYENSCPAKDEFGASNMEETHFDGKEGSSEGNNYFPDGPHSSNWRFRPDSRNGYGTDMGDQSKRANSFWSNKDSRFSKYSNNKGNGRWNRADAKLPQNHVYGGRSFNEDYSVRGNDSHFRNNDFESTSSRHKPGGFKPRHGIYERSSGNTRSYIRNGTTYYNQGWASIPRSGSSNSLENERLPVQDYGESKSRNFSAKNSAEPGETSEVGVSDEEFNRKKNYNPNKTSYKSRMNGEQFKKENASGRNVISSRSREDNRNDKDKNSKTNQRERLIDLLTRGVLECLVCCEQVHQNASVWSCSNCYHVLHLRCIIKWAKSSKSDFGWRCPACQNITRQVPYGYFCFCGKVRDPEWNRSDCPHSCGEICGKTQKKSCPHKCILLCHPGPCPQCTAIVVKSCGCQKTQRSVQCCNSDVVTCDTICGKTLNCKVHMCLQNCHMDACADCKEQVHQTCFCGKESRDINCTELTAGVDKYSCDKICGLRLSCGNHFCDSVCHPGECKKCELLPEVVKFCPCGKTKISTLSAAERTSCTDPIPTCELLCGKDLICGQPGNRHTCQSTCHEGPCPVCPLETAVKCRCGNMDKMLPCSELLVRADDARCNKRCTKKRSCGKHKCNQTCCIDIDHICPLPCNRVLQCNLHRCEETCHRGHCRPCWRASFEELYCECGAEVIYPPVPCGTRRPPCTRPCTRTHNCEHPPTHNCHSASQCPPCTVLTKKYCHGRHELRKAVLCHQDTFSCGLPCNKELSCGRHKCILPCHEGLCLKEGQICTQPCNVPRPICGHPCSAPCHEGPCPSDLPCKNMVKVTCECGHRYVTRACHDNAKEYHRIATAQLATKMADLQAGQTIDLDEVVLDSSKLSYKTLECNEECKLIDRNRRLAIGLQIRNPDPSAKLTPRYSEFMKHWAKKDPRFCKMVHDKLTDLVQLAKQSKQKSRSFSFDPMNREKRQFVHEYCVYFGCKSVAYDPEPKRNVVATATKDQSWLPSMSLLEVIQRESYPRKVPAPVNVKMTALPKNSQRTMEVLPMRSSKNPVTVNNENSASNQPAAAQIDYFDLQPSTS